MMPEPQVESALAELAQQLGCTLEELHSSMQEAGRVHFQVSPSEQYELDLGAPAESLRGRGVGDLRHAKAYTDANERDALHADARACSGS
jgi:hypothetical protein